MDSATFRTDFPEFSDTTRYPDSTINFYISLGKQLNSEERFGTFWFYAIELFTAHNLVLFANNIASSSAGGIPGSIGGAVSSKSVGSASVSYDSSNSSEKDAGIYNQTSYGRQYIHLTRLLGQGCYVV